MTPLEEQVMRTIAAKQAAHMDSTVASISRKMRVHHETITHPMAHLKRKGLIEVIEKQSDGVKLYCLTATGWAAIQVAPPMGMEPV